MRTTLSVRLPPDLEQDARQRAQRLGVSLNALLCVALDAYLRSPVGHPAPVTPPDLERLPDSPAPQNHPLPPDHPSGLSRAERRRLKRQDAK